MALDLANLAATGQEKLAGDLAPARPQRDPELPAAGETTVPDVTAPENTSGQRYDDGTATPHVGLTGPMDYPLHACLCARTPLGPTNVAAALVDATTVREAKAILAQRSAEHRLEQLHATLSQAEALVARMLDTIGYMAIHIQDRWMVAKLTTEQKELWADACDAWGRRLYADDPEELAKLTPYDRWWRS